MELSDQLNDRTHWSEKKFSRYQEYVIEHSYLPIEIVTEKTQDENWVTWLHVKQESFETEIPDRMFNKTFESRREARDFARKMAYNGGIARQLDT